MSINFQTIPQNFRIPLFFAEVNNSQANTALPSQRTLPNSTALRRYAALAE